MSLPGCYTCTQYQQRREQLCYQLSVHWSSSLRRTLEGSVRYSAKLTAGVRVFMNLYLICKFRCVETRNGAFILLRTLTKAKILFSSRADARGLCEWALWHRYETIRLEDPAGKRVLFFAEGLPRWKESGFICRKRFCIF